MVPSPPGRFSTIKLIFGLAFSMMLLIPLKINSLHDPGANQITAVIGLVGYQACADNDNNANAKNLIIFMFSPI
jgi:hypothetical protein